MTLDLIISLSKQISTLIFFTFFMTIIYLTYRKGKKNEIESIKFSIFEEEELRGMR